jgi:hypothetical protein
MRLVEPSAAAALRLVSAMRRLETPERERREQAKQQYAWSASWKMFSNKKQILH